MSEAEGGLEGFDPSKVFNSDYGPFPGNAILILHPEQEQVVGRCAAVPFSFRTKEDEKAVYRGLTVIVPPAMVWSHDDEATIELMVDGIGDMDAQLREEDRAAIRRLVVLRRCATLSSDEVLNEIRNAGVRQFVFVPWVTLYRSGDGSQARQPAGCISLEEDSWVSSTAELAEAALEVAVTTESYLLFTSPADRPAKDESMKRLEAIDGLAMVTIGGGAQTPPMTQLTRLLAMAKCGRAVDAVALLEVMQLPELFAEQMRMQIANAAGDQVAAAQRIRSLLGRTSVLGGVAVQWARICILGDDEETAGKLLAVALTNLADERQLEQCLDMATELGRSDFVELARNRLSELFPDNDGLRLDSEVRLLQLCCLRGPDISPTSISRAGFTEHHDFIAAQLTADEAPAFKQVVEDVGMRWPEQQQLASLCAALRAEALGRGLEAMHLAIPLVGESRFSRGATRVVLRVMRQMLFADEVRKEDVELYKAPLAAVITHLGQHPGDADLRAHLIKTLSVERAGSIGLPLLASVTLDFTLSAPTPAAEPVEIEEASEEELKEFLQRMEGWAATGLPVIDPRVPFPSNVAGANAARLARLMLGEIQRNARMQNTVESLQACEVLLHCIPPMIANVPDGVDDIHAFRTVAGKYALLGAHQLARDRAELVMEIGDGSPQRKRLAWAAYADIYLRTRGIPDALLGLACAASTQAQLPGSDLYLEVYALARVTRDLGLIEISEGILNTCHELYAGLGMTEIMRNRLDATALSLRLRKVAADDVEGLGKLLEDCQAMLNDAMRLGDELAVASFLFAQVATTYEAAGGQVPEESSVLKNKVLELLGEGTSTFLRAVSTTRPTAGDLLALRKLTTGARYSADAPTDAFAVHIAAHRLLRAENTQVTPREAFLAAELLTDQGLTQTSAHPELTADWPLQYAQDLAQRGYSVLMVAFDDTRELVAAIADSTGAYVARPAVVAEPAERRLAAWSRTYPYRYGLINPREMREDERTTLKREVGDGEFYASMEQFEVPVPQGDRILVVAEPEAAQLVFNLVLKDGEFVGYSRALGMVPSLAWLAEARKRTRVADIDRRIAWISAGRSREELQAMEVVRAMIETSLHTHNISLDTANALPEGAQGGQMGIVVAHGQLTSDERYFQRVVDEGVLKEAPEDLADAFANTELVILFVCSGGRVDVHPLVSTTLGLPKMLLNNGCRTVIASPWPLESLAPGIWLPKFLELWEQGASAMAACHAANLQVANRREREPQVSLAMTVYGDPLLTKPGAALEAGSMVP